MKILFDRVSTGCSRLVTSTYSTSFRIGIACMEKRLRDPVHSIYGFVRLADEIVDSFHEYDKAALLQRLKEETFKSIEEKISLNPILNNFQSTVHLYKIEKDLISRFLDSMEMDLTNKSYDANGLKEYISGSAEVVGLMCLRVFTNGNRQLYDHLKSYAMRLGAAFQKINFLRDLKSDCTVLGRVYFPGVRMSNFDEQSKKEIEAGIEKDLADGFTGIKKLPRPARFGVYVAYVYYLALFKKIKSMSPHTVLTHRIRIRNRQKATLLAYSFVKHRLNMI